MEANRKSSQDGYRVEIGQESYFCSTQEQAQAIHDAMKDLFGKDSRIVRSCQKGDKEDVSPSLPGLFSRWARRLGKR